MELKYFKKIDLNSELTSLYFDYFNKCDNCNRIDENSENFRHNLLIQIEKQYKFLKKKKKSNWNNYIKCEKIILENKITNLKSQPFTEFFSSMSSFLWGIFIFISSLSLQPLILNNLEKIKDVKIQTEFIIKNILPILGEVVIPIALIILLPVFLSKAITNNKKIQNNIEIKFYNYCLEIVKNLENN